MISDLGRGPVLELAIAKIVHARTTLDDQAVRVERVEHTQIVGVSTEGSDSAPMSHFLSAWDAGRRIPPVEIASSVRPVPLRHMLVLPPDVEHEAYEAVEIGEHSSADVDAPALADAKRTVPIAERKRLNRFLEHRHRRVSSRDRGGSPQPEMELRLTNLIGDRLRERAHGEQHLVFVPSRARIEDPMVGQLANRIKASWAPDELANRKAHFREGMCVALEDALARQEDDRLSGLVRKYAEYGILIHHSDISKEVRGVIENLCASIEPDDYSRVVYATETLSYGVNLAISRVFLLGTDFTAQSRSQEVSSTPLSQCAYHNMLGRAGRLGKDDEGLAFVIVPKTESGDRVIRDYYATVDSTGSRLYERDDQRAQVEVERNPWLRELAKVPVEPIDSVRASLDEFPQYAHINATHFSYPFARSVLDALRHMNSIVSGASHANHLHVSFADLMVFLGRTLYMHELGDDDENERTLFRSAVWRVLESCAEKPLELVRRKDAASLDYVITERGRAAIDTGTELTTIAPLLTSVGDVTGIWEEHAGAAEFPTELYVLPILMQHESLRSHIGRTPEVFPRHQWPAILIEPNRAAVARLFIKALQRVVPPDACEAHVLAEGLRELLQGPTSEWKFAAAYPFGTADGVMRLVSAVLAWIDGESRPDVYKIADGEGELDDTYRGRMQGFAQFAEHMRYKAELLGRILRPERVVLDETERARELALHSLAARLRVGCAEEAIPLFHPGTSNLSRSEAAKLIETKRGPQELLRTPRDAPSGLPPERYATLIGDLENSIRKQLDEISKELTVGDVDQRHRPAVDTMWTGVLAAMEKCTEPYRSHSILDACVGPVVCAPFLPDENDPDSEGRFFLTAKEETGDAYRAWMEVEAAGQRFIGQRLVRVDAPDGEAEASTWQHDAAVAVEAVQFRADWQYMTALGQWASFQDVLERHRRTDHLVIVAFPWLPSPANMPEEVRRLLVTRRQQNETTTVVTPAAFCAMMTCIMRRFASARDCLRALTNAPDDSRLLSSVTVRDVLSIVDTVRENQMPPVIRECLVRFYEVGPGSVTA